jgi:multimeric flavodoxin WrbA
MSSPREQPHVVAVIGSPRPHGNTATLVDAALEELERRGCRCTRIMLGQLRIAACNGHVNCDKLEACPHDDDAASVLDAVYAADGLVLASPVYYDNVSGQMKTFMDRNVFRYYQDEWLRARVVGLIAVAMESGLDETLDAMRRFVALISPSTRARLSSEVGDAQLGVQPVDLNEKIPTISVSGYANKPGEAAANEALMAEARQLGASMAEALGAGPD